MVNRIAFLNEQIERRSIVPRFGDLRAQQPLYLAAPPCAVPPLMASELLDLMRGSISLGLVEKCHVLTQLAALPKEKLVGLMEIFREEQTTFRNLPDDHHQQLLTHERQVVTDWWRIEHWFWEHGQISVQPMLWIGKADPVLPPDAQHTLLQMIPS